MPLRPSRWPGPRRTLVSAHQRPSTPSRSHSPRTSSARLVDRTAPGATRPWRRQRATASRPLAGPRPARTLTTSPRDTSSCTSDGPLISCRDRAPAAVTVAREPTAASSQPKGCAPTPAFGAQYGGFATDWSPVSWGSLDELFVNLTIPGGVHTRAARPRAREWPTESVRRCHPPCARPRP